MLTLILFRHAKSDWDDAALEDFDRPLSKRGRRDAPHMGRFIAAHVPPVDLVLCSAAVRTEQTWALASAELEQPPPQQSGRELYLAEPAALIQQIKQVAAPCATLLVVGHNPGLHELAVALCSDGGSKALRKAIAVKFPTAGVAVFQFRVKSWAKIKPGSGLLAEFMTPRRLGDAD
jgi:phosphohistidine phosphatase